MSTSTIDNHDKKFDITTDELASIEKNLKNPEFMKLLADYMKDISDPNILKENETYIKQFEKSNEETFISPIYTGYTIHVNQLYYINICYFTNELNEFKRKKLMK